MKYKNFYAFQEVCEQFYKEKKYDKALNFLNQANTFLPQTEYESNQFELLFQEALFYTELSDSDSCMEIVLRCAAMGFAFPLDWNRFKFLKEYTDYEKIYNKNQILLEKLRKNSNFQYEVHLPLNYDESETHPLFICLHGDGFGCNIEGSKYNWKPDVLLKKGYIVVYAQSSQVYCQKCHGWLIDLEQSRKDLKNIYCELLKSYKIDENKVVLGGFSGGASMAIDLAYHNVLPLKGVIALCPGDHLTELNTELISEMVKRDIKIVMIEGEKSLEPVVQHLLKLFQQSGISYRYHVEQGMEHEYPKELCIHTHQALSFIETDNF